MKALSIIGILISSIGIIYGFMALTYSGGDHENGDLHVVGGIMLFISFYFLAFSIVSSVISFSKKKVDAAQN